jgi:hypothetical protein
MSDFVLFSRISSSVRYHSPQKPNECLPTELTDTMADSTKLLRKCTDSKKILKYAGLVSLGVKIVQRSGLQPNLEKFEGQYSSCSEQGGVRAAGLQ